VPVQQLRVTSAGPPEVQELIGGRDRAGVNRQLARVETVKKFRLIEQLLTPEDEELTPTMKLKRTFVNVEVQGPDRQHVRKERRMKRLLTIATRDRRGWRWPGVAAAQKDTRGGHQDRDRARHAHRPLGPRRQPTGSPPRTRWKMRFDEVNEGGRHPRPQDPARGRGHPVPGAPARVAGREPSSSTATAIFAMVAGPRHPDEQRAVQGPVRRGGCRTSSRSPPRARCTSPSTS